MLKHYALVATRSLRRQASYGVINVVGLAVGMACCVLVYLYVRAEAGYDRFHDNADRVVRVVRERQRGPGDWGRLAVTPWRIAPLMEQAVPQVEKTVRISPQEMLLRAGDQAHVEPGLLLADAPFFEVFDGFELLRGDPARALAEPFSLVLTAPMAAKYFGEADPLGRVVRVDDRHDFTVTGVVAEAPAASHFRFDALASMSSAPAMWSSPEMFESLGAVWLYTYLLLEPGTDLADVEAGVAGLIAAHVPERSAAGTFRLPLQPLTDIHLHSDYDNELEANGDVRRLYFLSVLAAFILLLAGVNYVNLATARAAQRAREVGVRKAAGAGRGQLIGQFLSEALLLSFAALLGAVLLARAALPAFNDLAGTSLRLALDPWMAGGLALLAVGVGLLAGGYPAFHLARFRPAAVLKGERVRRGGAWLRQGLVVFQFAVTIALLVGTGVVYQQLRYVQQKALGFEDEHLVVVRLNHREAREGAQALRAAFERLPHVRSVSAASSAPGDGLNTWSIRWPGMPEGLDLPTPVMAVDEAYIGTLGLELVAGRGFSAERATDATSAFVLNRAAVERYGFEEPVGQRVSFWVGDALVKEGEVIGVVEDFHTTSLREAIRPVALTVRPSWYGQLLVRVDAGGMAETVDALEAAWGAFAADWPFEFGFLDERVARLYDADRRLGRIFGVFSGLAIAIACLGLLGLAAFVTERRTREIGVRKALGASVAGIVRLLLRDFARPVLVAVVVAAPIAHLAMQRWLEGFAYRVELAWWLYPAVGAAALAIAFAAVGAQTLRAATADPVQALRQD